MNFFRNKIQEELNAKIEQLESTIAILDDENSKLNEENKTLSQEVLELKNSLQTKVEETEVIQEELTEVVEEVKELVEEKESVEEVATKKAVEILASVGQPPVDVHEDLIEEQIENGAVSVADKIKTLNGAELLEFFKSNKNEIFKLLKK